MEYVWIENYNTAFFTNAHFNGYMLDFLIMQAAYVPVITVIAFILALLLNRNIKGRSIFRAIFFLPVIVMSGPVMGHLADAGANPLLEEEVVAAMTWMNNIAAHMHPWFSYSLSFIYDNFTTVLWFTGIPVILFLSALQKIDNGVLEAARIDAATDWQILWLITIPILKPIILVAVILTIVQLASYELNPVLPFIQEAIFSMGSGLGLASAYAWVYSLAVMLLIGIAFLLLKNRRDVVPPEVERLQKKWNE